jgi:hypothetical protein
VSAFAVDAATQRLTLLNSVSSRGAGGTRVLVELPPGLDLGDGSGAVGRVVEGGRGLDLAGVLCDAVGHLGYIPKLAAILIASSGKPARYNLGIQSVRVLQVLAGTRSSLQALARANVVPAMLKALASPLPRAGGSPAARSPWRARRTAGPQGDVR